MLSLINLLKWLLILNANTVRCDCALLGRQTTRHRNRTSGRWHFRHCRPWTAPYRDTKWQDVVQEYARTTRILQCVLEQREKGKKKLMLGKRRSEGFTVLVQNPLVRSRALKTCHHEKQTSQPTVPTAGVQVHDPSSKNCKACAKWRFTQT